MEDKFLQVKNLSSAAEPISAWLSLLELNYGMNYLLNENPQSECSQLTFICRCEFVIYARISITRSSPINNHVMSKSTANVLYLGSSNLFILLKGDLL